MRKFLTPALIVIVVVGYMTLTLLSMNANSHRLLELAKENNVYHRTNSCILSVPLATRTDDYISNCYQRAENRNHIKVDRFGGK